MGRRRDHKPDPRMQEREIVDPHTRQTVKVTHISAGLYLAHKNRNVKLGSKWSAQTEGRQRGKKSRKFRIGYKTAWEGECV